MSEYLHFSIQQSNNLLYFITQLFLFSIIWSCRNISIWIYLCPKLPMHFWITAFEFNCISGLSVGSNLYQSIVASPNTGDDLIFIKVFFKMDLPFIIPFFYFIIIKFPLNFLFISYLQNFLLVTFPQNYLAIKYFSMIFMNHFL